MADIHVAAGLPPGHGDPCTCGPIAYATPGGTIVIHRIAAPEMLRPEHPEASHAQSCRDCGHPRNYHPYETGRHNGYELADLGECVGNLDVRNALDSRTHVEACRCTGYQAPWRIAAEARTEAALPDPEKGG